MLDEGSVAPLGGTTTCPAASRVVLSELDAPCAVVELSGRAILAEGRQRHGRVGALGDGLVPAVPIEVGGGIARVGRVHPTRRRAPGLRREELAALTGVSVEYLVRLEQGRARNSSPQLLGALARALRLTDDERDHLYQVAGVAPPSLRVVS